MSRFQPDSWGSRRRTRKQAYQIPVRVVGRLTDPQEFDDIVVKNTATGLVQLKDVGHAEIGAESYGTALKYAGHVAMGLGVEQLSVANSIDVDRKAKAALAELSKSFPPGLHYAIAFDSTTAVGESIHEVLVTLAAAIVIVIAVIFLFLLDWRATIIPAVTIPVSFDRNVCVYPDLRFFNQLTYAVWHHAGHGAGGRRRHCGD